MKNQSCIRLLVVTLLTLGVCTPLVSLAHAGTITDSFDGPYLNTRLWRAFADDRTQWVQQGGELRITIVPGGTECVQVESKFLLKGDFEMTVDYRLITWAAANGGRLGFEGPGYSGTDYTMCMVKRISHDAGEQPNPGEEVFAAGFKEGTEWSFNEVLTVNTADEYGSLKLTRVGNRMIGSYSRNGDPWQEITSRDYGPTGLPEWYAMALSVCGRQSTNVAIAFTNFQVTYDQVKFISDLSPLNLLLLE
jgi:hypothetical protein